MTEEKLNEIAKELFDTYWRTLGYAGFVWAAAPPTTKQTWRMIALTAIRLGVTHQGSAH